MADDKAPPRKPLPAPDADRTEAAREAAQEYLDEQRAVAEKLRKKMS